MVWLMTNISSTVYCIFWDIVMDWGLPRELLSYPSISYAFAIVANAFLRFAWTIPFLLPIPYDSQTISVAHQSIEIVRRSLWNIFRIENEDKISII